MNRDELLSLAERCEAAAGPNLELDLAIVSCVRQGWRHPDFISPPCYTASLDAAMTLVPEGWDFRVERFGEGKACSWCWARGYFDDSLRCPEAATPALALTAACLRARASKEQS